MKTYILAAALAALPGAAIAADNVVSTTSQSVTLGGVTFGAGVIENSAQGGSVINATQPGTTAGDTGSLQVYGDKTRYVIGNPYGSATSPGFLLSDLQSLTFDWATGRLGTQQYAAPVARVIVADTGGVRTELVWEYIYNGGSTNQQVPLNIWTAAGTGADWYANIRGPGTNAARLAAFKANSQTDIADYQIASNGVLIGPDNLQTERTLGSWTQLFSANARVISIGFGAGSGFGEDFYGYVDNVAVTTSLGTDRINFEPLADAVPEPGTWALMLGGFGLVGGTLRRRAKATVRFA